MDTCRFMQDHKSRRHQMLSKLSSLSIAFLRILDEEANKSYNRKHDFYQTALTRCYTQHALRSYIDSEINHIRHFIKFRSSIRVSISSIYLVYLETIQLNRLYQIILKIKNCLLFGIDISNLLEVQYSISKDWLLILILIQRLQIHEIAKI